MSARFWPITASLAALLSIILTWQVHSRTGDETFVCADLGDCALGSGWSWLLTGIATTGPFLAVLGVAWSRHLFTSNKLGPFSYRAIPDGEQIIEVVTVLLAGLFTYWFVRNGPSIELARPTDIGAPNTWALDIRNARLEEGAAELNSVPSRLNWFIIGVVLGAPFATSFGTMLGREFYGRRNRKPPPVAAGDDVIIDLTEDDSIDLTETSQPTKNSTSSADASPLDEIDFDTD